MYWLETTIYIFACMCSQNPHQRSISIKHLVWYDENILVLFHEQLKRGPFEFVRNTDRSYLINLNVTEKDKSLSSSRCSQPWFCTGLCKGLTCVCIFEHYPCHDKVMNMGSCIFVASPLTWCLLRWLLHLIHLPDHANESTRPASMTVEVCCVACCLLGDSNVSPHHVIVSECRDPAKVVCISKSTRL